MTETNVVEMDLSRMAGQGLPCAICGDSAVAAYILQDDYGHTVQIIEMLCKACKEDR